MSDFRKQLHDICDRPELYVGYRQFQLVAAWLDGFSGGLYECKQGGASQIGINGFREWLSEKFYESHGIERNLVWQAYITRVYPEDNDA